jgi:hypothetical protein
VRRAFLALALTLLPAACEHRTVHEDAERASLGGDTVATVGGARIPASLVAEVARAQGVEPRVALDRVIDDALAYQEALAEGADRAPTMHWALESTTARATAEHIKDATAAAGPPTDAELAATTARHWRDFDHGEEVRTIHALVVRPKDPKKVEAARALAEQLLAAEAGATSDDDFEARAKALPRGDLGVTVERLPLIVADGRTAEGEPGTMDAAFTHAAFLLTRPGDQSGVVESPFGWHVIRLIERRPAKVVPAEERRVTFGSEILAERGHKALRALLDARRATTRIDIQPASEELMDQVARSPSPPGEP